MTIYTPQDYETAQALLLQCWSAEVAPLRRRMAEMETTDEKPPRHSGLCLEVIEWAKTQTAPFTRIDAAPHFPKFTEAQVASALGNAVQQGRLVVIGKAKLQRNLYQWSGK